MFFLLLQVCIFFFFFFFKYFYCIPSDFSDLPDMTDEYIDLSVYALTGWLLYILHLKSKMNSVSESREERHVVN